MKQFLNKEKINDILFMLLIIFPITTLIQGLPVLEYINKVMIGLVIILLSIKVFFTNITIKNIIILSLTAIVYIFSFIHTKGNIENINTIFYFGLWILLFIYLKDNYKEFLEINNKKLILIKYVVIMWNILVLVSLFYNNSFVSEWDGKYFCSFSNGCHRFASSCIFIFFLNFILRNKSKEKKYSILFLIPYISVFFSGARIYLILIILSGVSILYCLCKNKKDFIISTILLIIISLILVLFTPMGEKFISSLNLNMRKSNFVDNTNIEEGEAEIIEEESETKVLINSITSGRTIFWEADIKGYLNLNPLKKLVGNGYNYVYDINEKAAGVRIYAHNDILNIILNYGLIGTFIYLYVFMDYILTFIKSKKISILLLLAFIGIYFSNAMINQVYTYVCCVFSIPFILYCYSLRKYKKF